LVVKTKAGVAQNPVIDYPAMAIDKGVGSEVKAAVLDF
jgi:hypothetical protein